MSGAALFKKIQTKDVCPLPIGIEVEGGVIEVVIPKNSQIPISQAIRLQTMAKDCRKFELFVYEGEFAVAKKNRRIWSDPFVIEPLHTGTAGEVFIDVTLALDRSGLLAVEAYVVGHPELMVKASALASSGRGDDISGLQIQTEEVRDRDEKEAQALARRSQLKSLCSNMKEFADEFRSRPRYRGWQKQRPTAELFAEIQRCETMTEAPTDQTFGHLRELCRRAFAYFAILRPVPFPAYLGMDADQMADP
jgi:molecular chaperone DnaK (HSP70)